MDDSENFSDSPDGGTERAKRFALLHSLAAKFLHDVEVSAHFAGEVDIVESTEQKGVFESTLWLQGTGRGFFVQERRLNAEYAEGVLAELADYWSEPVMEAVLEAAGVESARLWPKCPIHMHALNPEVRAGRARWCCPVDKTITFLIGDLPAAPKGT